MGWPNSIGLATKWLRILSLGGNGKIRNHLVANPIHPGCPTMGLPVLLARFTKVILNLFYINSPVFNFFFWV